GEKSSDHGSDRAGADDTDPRAHAAPCLLLVIGRGIRPEAIIAERPDRWLVQAPHRLRAIDAAEASGPIRYQVADARRRGLTHPLRYALTFLDLDLELRVFPEIDEVGGHGVRVGEGLEVGEQSLGARHLHAPEERERALSLRPLLRIEHDQSFEGVRHAPRG